MDAVAVELSHPDIGKIDVPHSIRAFTDAYGSRLFRLLGFIEQAKIDILRPFGEKREIGSLVIHRSPLGSWQPGLIFFPKTGNGDSTFCL